MRRNAYSAVCEGKAYMLGGLTILAVLGCSICVWAATTRIAGAVISAGVVVVAQYPKVVQPTGAAAVKEILVTDGDKVKAGDVVVRLDDTVARANVRLTSAQIDETKARLTRLRAELVDADLAENDFNDHSSSATESTAVAEELALFRSRLAGRLALNQLCSARIGQVREELSGLESQRFARLRQLDLARDELSGLETLEGQNLVAKTKITASRRGVAQLDGDIAQITAQYAQAKEKALEHEAMIKKNDYDFKSQVGKEIREQQSRLSELNENMVAAADRLSKTEIRAPVDGVVSQMSIHTIGGVVADGQAMMTIVPTTDRLVVDAKLAPKDIDQIAIGHEADVRFSAFSQSSTPTYKATVSRVSADVMTRDLSTPSSSELPPYYLARLEVAPSELAKGGELNLVPGMPVEIFFRTRERTAFTYLVKPLSDQFARAFREE